MLILARDVKESVELLLPDGQKIVVYLLATGIGRAKLGFEAPSWVKISRVEVKK